MKTKEKQLDQCPYCGEDSYTCDSRGISPYTGFEQWIEHCANWNCPINQEHRNATGYYELGD